MRKALITGAAGFLGQHVAQYFLKQGWEVIATDRGAPTLRESNHYSFIRLALPDAGIQAVLIRAQPDVIIHCAGKASVAESIQDPHSDHSSQVGITDDLLRAASCVASLSRFVYLSSAAVYGNPEAMPVNEGSRLAPISPYGEHKKLAEGLCQHAYRSLGMPTTIARIFSAYGPGLKRQVIYETCRQAVCNRNVRLQGSGKETRDFIHATDVAQAIYLLAIKPEAVGHPFNVATGVEIAIEEVASVVCKKTNVVAPSFSGNRRAGDPERWVADVSALRSLGFSAAYHFEDGLENTLDWVKTVPCG